MHIREHLRRRRAPRVIAPVAALSLALLAAGCGSSGGGGTAAGHEGHGGGRAYFVEPKDGATVKSPVKFVFGVDNYTISPVPQGDVTQAREGMGHYHLGVDADCLPAGQAIPKGTPGWVHFGKGDNTMEMQLTPGPHKFSVQVGDDLHKTVTGLCQTINVNVQP
jgi:hypothetical protein